MQAYQSAPCPSCGATWNQPGAQTCANCRNPLPPAQPSYAPPGYAPPGYAQGPAYPQPPAGYGQPAQYPTFVPGAAAAPSQGSTTLNLLGQRITIPMVLPSALVARQKQIVYAIAGFVALLLLLFSVAPALAAGQIAGSERMVAGTVADQAKVMLPVYDAMIDFTKMYAALNKHDLAGAGAPYPDAQHKMQLAMSLDHAAGVPETLAKQLADFNDLVNNTEALVTAIQSNDSAGTKKYSGLVQASLKLLAPLANAITPAYEAKTYGHLQKGYEASIRALKN